MWHEFKKNCRRFSETQVELKSAACNQDEPFCGVQNAAMTQSLSMSPKSVKVWAESQTMMTSSQGQATRACPGTISRLMCRLLISEVLFAHTVASRDFLWFPLPFSRSALGPGASRALDASLRAARTGCPGGGKGNPPVCLCAAPSLTLTGPSEQRQRLPQAWHSAARFVHSTLRTLGLSVR